MLANQRELDVIARLEALERAVFGTAQSVVPEAPAPKIDRAAKVRADAQRVRLARGSEPVTAPEPEIPDSPETPVDDRVNINTATLGELTALEGVGKARAERIIEQRPYESVEDLLKIKGTKAAILQAIVDDNRDRITAGND